MASRRRCGIRVILKTTKLHGYIDRKAAMMGSKKNRLLLSKMTGEDWKRNDLIRIDWFHAPKGKKERD